MAGLGNFAAGFLQAFGAAKQHKKEQDLADQQKKALMDLYEVQLERGKAENAALLQQQNAQNQLYGQLQTGNAQSGQKYSLADLLADPKNAPLVLRSGVLSGKDLLASSEQNQSQALLQQVLGGGGISESGATGGAPTGQGGTPYEISGIKLGPNGQPMFDLSRKGEINTWKVAPDGRTLMGINKMGQLVTTMPASPADRAPEDRPLTPAELSSMRDPQGKMLRPGTTIRDAQAMGATTAPAPAEADKQKSVLLDGMRAAQSTLDKLTGNVDTSSLKDRTLESNKITALKTSPEYRKYKAAAKQWVQNYVFLKSGAQAGPAETQDSFEIYFPQPGDSQEVKDQKAIMRQQEMANMAAKYGNQGTPQLPAQGAPPLIYDPATGTFK